MHVGKMRMGFLAGTDIEEAAREADRISKMLGVLIEFGFNDKELVAYPKHATESNVDRIVAEYHDEGNDR